jgi:hypothetical protein
MKNSRPNRFDQAFLTVFGSIGTIGPVFHRFEREVAKNRPVARQSN